MEVLWSVTVMTGRISGLYMMSCGSPMVTEKCKSKYKKTWSPAGGCIYYEQIIWLFWLPKNTFCLLENMANGNKKQCCQQETFKSYVSFAENDFYHFSSHVCKFSSFSTCPRWPNHSNYTRVVILHPGFLYSAD